MGVKDLWNILSPVCNKISINELQGKTLAIDLSCWVCEGQFVGDKSGATNPRMYLRNVFFRTHALLMINVKPVFVLDGKAPELKRDAMKQRNNTRFRRFKKPKRNEDEEADDPKKGGRSHFKGILKQCREMLELMGVACVQSDGEAEGLCGQLNREGLVDGVITQDSDVFCYGAKVVYRNLAVANGTGTVDAYDMINIETKLKLTREKMVAMSLLCGCDYDLQGVQGIGKESAFKYLSSFNGDILEQFRSLRTNEALIKLEEEKGGCTRCSHAGKASEHRKTGCQQCRMTKSCVENVSPTAYKNLSEERKKEVNLELNLRRKAVTDPAFPNENTINEYLCTQQTLDEFDPSWKKPNICRFVNYCCRKMEWVIEYGIQKIFPMLARWILLRTGFHEDDQVLPKEIARKRVVKGVSSYELVWKITDEKLVGFLALLMDDPPDTFSSTEPQSLIAQALPAIHETFIENTGRNKPAKKPAARKRKAKQSGDAVDDLNIVETVSFDSLSPVQLQDLDSKFTESPSTSIESEDSQAKDIETAVGSKTPISVNVSLESNSTSIDSDSDSIIEIPVTKLDKPKVAETKDFDIAAKYTKFFPEEPLVTDNYPADNDDFSSEEPYEINYFEYLNYSNAHGEHAKECSDDDTQSTNKECSPRESLGANQFKLMSAGTNCSTSESPIVEPAKKLRKSDHVNFSLGLESFCDMTIASTDKESDSDSDISILVEKITSRKLFTHDFV